MGMFFANGTVRDTRNGHYRRRGKNMATLIEQRFEVPKIPQTTHQSGTRIDFRSRRTYKSKQLLEVEAMYKALLRPYAPEQPAEGGILVEIDFLYKATKKLRPLPRLARPDVDNMAKTVLDIMTQLHFWNDDSQVVFLADGKEYSDHNEIYIKAMEVDRMITIGSKRSIQHLTKQFAEENGFYGNKHLTKKLNEFVYQHHRIGDFDRYNLNNVDVTCKVFYHRWLTGA